MKRTLLLVSLTLVTMMTQAQTEATYRIVYESNWSQATHPHSSGDLPSNAHWSRLVGATHNSQVDFLEMGEPASEAVENIAELGSNTLFFDVVDDAIDNGWANQTINGPDLDTPLGQIVLGQVVTTDSYPLITLMSMIAPSPDWMIAVDAFSLVDENDDWIDNLSVDLYAYDAGTDSGMDYTSPNMDTDPAEPISSLQNVTPFSNEVIGTISFELTNLLDVSSPELESFTLFPNPARNAVTVQSPVELSRVEIFNVLGERMMLVDANGQKQRTLDLQQMSPGIYLLRVRDIKGQVSTRKLVKR